MGNVIALRPGREPKQPRPGSDPRPLRPARKPELLWREALGEQLRAERRNRGQRIADIAGRAGVSPQYLSELERGRKDPSSEILSAVSGALELSVRELTWRAGRHLSGGAVCMAA